MNIFEIDIPFNYLDNETKNALENYSGDVEYWHPQYEEWLIKTKWKHWPNIFQDGIVYRAKRKD